MKYAALGLAFILELTAFVGFAGLGFSLQAGTPIRVLASMLLFVALVIFWSIFMAPKAPKKFPPFAYYFAKAVVYALAAHVILVRVSTPAGITFVVLAIIDEVFLFRHNLSQKNHQN